MAKRKLSPTDYRNITDEIITKRVKRKDIAKQYGIHIATVHSIFKRVAGKSPRAFFAEEAEEKAKEKDLLKTILGENYELVCTIAAVSVMPIEEVVRKLISLGIANGGLNRIDPPTHLTETSDTPTVYTA